MSKKGHSIIEEQSSEETEEETLHDILLNLKHSKNRSWVQLRKGCLDMLEKPVEFSTKSIKSTSRAFAKQASEKTGLTYDQILSWLDENGLGLLLMMY